MSQVPSDVVKRISLALLTAPPQTEAGIAWSTTYNFKSIKQFYESSNGDAISQANDKLTYLLMFVWYVVSTPSEKSKGGMARELPR